MRKAIGVVVVLIGAAITALTPDSVWGQVAYLVTFAGVVTAAWVAVRRPGPRLPWVLIAAAVTSWLVGDITYNVLQLAGLAPDVGVQDMLWLGGYPLMGAAILSMVRRRAPAQGRAALQDGLTLTTAAMLAAWRFFIAPELQGGGPMLQLIVGALYPTGDLVLFAAVAYLVLSPGRNGAPSALLIAGTSLTLVLDGTLTLFSNVLSSVDADRFNGALLLANALIVGSMLRHDRDELLEPVRLRTARLHPARMIFLGLAMLTGPILAVAREAGPVTERMMLLGATAVTVGLCLARFTQAVREQGRAQERLAFLADHDSLTGLVNRRVLNERLAGDFRPRSDLALLYLDLDGFKAVNDEYGHAAGDAVLVEAARRIRNEIRAGDLAVRLGGDEFAVLSHDLTVDEGRVLAERLRRAVSAPIVSGDLVLRVGVSVGLASAETCAHGDDLLSRADEAMFEAKRAQRPARTG